jgi:hypothetical protein
MNATRLEGNRKMQQAVRPISLIVKMQQMMHVLLEIVSVFPARRASCAHPVAQCWLMPSSDKRNVGNGFIIPLLRQGNIEFTVYFLRPRKDATLTSCTETNKHVKRYIYPYNSCQNNLYTGIFLHSGTIIHIHEWSTD